MVSATSPRVSVLVPCYNAAATLDEALESLASQTFPPFEIIAVDDGSDDETPVILQRWQRQLRRIRTLRGSHNGVISALNSAASLARGELLARMDADDICWPRRLEKQVALLEAHAQLAGCGTKVRYFPRRSLSAGARRYENWVNSLVNPAEIERDLFIECPIPHPTLLVRRAAFEAVGGYRPIPWPEDYDLILRLWASGHRLGKTAEVLLDWRDSGRRLSRVDPRYKRHAFMRCKTEFLPRLIRGRPVIVWGTGSVGRSLARSLKNKGECIHAFVTIDPARLGRSFQGRTVVNPATCPARGYFHIAAVGSREARSTIRTTLRAAGLLEMKDYCAVA